MLRDVLTGMGQHWAGLLLQEPEQGQDVGLGLRKLEPKGQIEP